MEHWLFDNSTRAKVLRDTYYCQPHPTAIVMSSHLEDRVHSIERQRLFSPRRIGVCGSSHGLPPLAVPLCRALGFELARHKHVTIVSGGARTRRMSLPSDFAVDWHIVSSAVDALNSDATLGDVDHRIETVTIDDLPQSRKFSYGLLRRARGGTHEARRFSFVANLDGLVAVGGSTGTGQSLALAIELGVHVLPIPLAGGEAKALWGAQRHALLKRLRLSEPEARQWESVSLADADATNAFAAAAVGALLQSMRRRCFVIMPFDSSLDALYRNVIDPAVRATDGMPNRLDVTATPGNVWQQIHDGLRNCDYVIAVLDGLRPNVLYELGMAHAFMKPTILLQHVAQGQHETQVPFDISMHQRLQYTDSDTTLQRRVVEMIRAIPVPRL